MYYTRVGPNSTDWFPYNKQEDTQTHKEEQHQGRMLKVTGDPEGWERGMGQTPQSLHKELTSTIPVFQLQVYLLSCERRN